MKYLITGVAGFIGSHLAEELLKKKKQVVGIDCFTDYYSRLIKEKNLSFPRAYDGFEFVEADVNEIELSGILSEVKGVFHLSAQAGVRASWGKDFDHYLENNIKATQRILEALKEFPEIKMVFASSSSVYGDTDQLPTPETARCQPLSPYGVSKLACEVLCNLYHKNYQVPVVSLRYFTVFGARQRPDMAFHKFIRAVLTQKPITVYGDGTQSRDFTYIKDIIKGTILAMERGEPGAIYNLGGGHQTRLIDAIHLIFELMGKDTELKFLPPEKGDVRHTLSDTEKVRKELGYNPKGNLELGLKEEIKWVEELLKENLYETER